MTTLTVGGLYTWQTEEYAWVFVELCVDHNEQVVKRNQESHDVGRVLEAMVKIGFNYTCDFETKSIKSTGVK